MRVAPHVYLLARRDGRLRTGYRLKTSKQPSDRKPQAGFIVFSHGIALAVMKEAQILSELSECVKTHPAYRTACSG